MSQTHVVRLLPWSRPDGKPCYLRTDQSNGYMWQLADNMEAIQLGMGTALIEHAEEVLSAPKVSLEEVRYLANRLVESLSDVLRIAESRGERLQASAPHGKGDGEGGDGDGPLLPADAFG
ncbi:hypothetical protein [Streptomyces purpurogeneiscleroticus]|uniref:hypothetical protein n=1 Tax=Streptomyces purpurogeneiscleroticus TaxID=68259 RepID=UPI001CC13956|nr:hypothetical protein [Streptomyces purpurogeneiscleroticus]MBZ4016110.1 hypothetical protein [Streptomyces purpurogeneiscleroticus]